MTTKTRFALVPLVSYMLVVPVLHFILGYKLVLITVSLYYVLKTLILSVRLKPPAMRF